LKNFNVGNPLISNFAEQVFYSVESTLAKTTGFSAAFKIVAALSYSGVSFLQCPHQGA